MKYLACKCVYLFVASLAAMLCGCGGGKSSDDAATQAEVASNAPAASAPAAASPPAAASAPATPATPPPQPAAPAAGEIDTSVAAAAAGLPTAAGGNLAHIGQFSTAELARTLNAGIAIWRTPRLDINGVDKGACANCHSSDGIELSLWKFSDDDVRRRAHLDGVSPTDRETLVQYFAALRQQYKVTALRDVLGDRPFQPRGHPFVGNTAERDYQFASESLSKVAPTLMGGTIDSVAKALQAKEELRISNPLDIKIGILLPRISDDCFRGAGHCTSNDWMADLPRIPKAERSAEWFALNDLYIADPSDDNLRTLLSAVETMTDAWVNPGETGVAQAGTLGTEKFKSMQILQHFLRRQQLGLFKPSDDQNPLAPLKSASQGLKRPNFPFLVGDFSFNKDGKPWSHPNEMPIFVRKSLGETGSRPLTDDDVARVKAEMDIPWWYVGFMFDANLGTGTNTEYFFGELATGPTAGYPFHHAYVVGKHAAIQTRAGGQASNDIAFAGGWKNVGDADQPRLFSSIEARQLYRHMESNWTLMWMLLAREQLEKSGVASFGTDSMDIKTSICAMPTGVAWWASLRGWANTAASFDAANAQRIFNLYNDVIAKANCGLAPLTATYQAGNGTGLLVEWFDGSGDEFNGKSSALTNKLGQRLEPIVAFPGRETGSGYYAEWTRSIGVNVVDNSSYSARGTGFVHAPVTGQYQFFLSGGFGKLSVGGKELYNEFRYNEGTPVRATISLQAGQRYPLVFERHGYAAGGMQLEWQTTDGTLPRQKIPTAQLSPN